MEQELTWFTPDPQSLACPQCTRVFRKPVTLNCGHSFCHHCLLRALHPQAADQAPLVPLCPTCRLIIWRPIAFLKQNVVLSNLISRFSLTEEEDRPSPIIPQNSEQQYHILLNCAQVSIYPLPHCYSQIVFATAFIDEIIEQQSQTNHIVLRWPNAPEGLAIAGRLMRPEIYHYSIKAQRHETVYRAQFEGKCFVKLLQTQEIDLKLHSSTGNQAEPTSLMILCRTEEQASLNPVPINSFNPFFQVYDKLNNPIYLRQISQLVDEKIFQQRNNPRKMIYCVLRVLKMPEKELSALVESMDDQIRLHGIEDFLVRSANKMAVDVIRVEIPGNYPHSLVFALLGLLIVIHYLAS